MIEVCEAIDREEISGKRAKKEAQAEVIVEVWEALFGSSLAREKAIWLVGKLGSATAVYNELEKVQKKGIEYPLAYISAGIKKKEEREDRKQTTAPEDTFDMEGYLKELDEVKSQIERLGLYGSVSDFEATTP